MRKLTILLLLVIVFIGGCQKTAQQEPVEVIIDGDGQFPTELVGTWTSEGKTGWEITFAEDGSISKVLVSLGKFEVIPGQTTVVSMKKGKKSVITPGQWLVQYSPAESALFVEIVLDSFHIEVGDGTIDGSSRSLFAGTVDLEANQWSTTWVLFREAIANTPEISNFDLSTNQDYGEAKQVVFNKVVE